MQPDNETLPPAPQDAAKPRFASALVLVNEKAGSVSVGDAEKLGAQLTAAGIERFAMIGADQISEALFARAPDFDLVIVLGGDGTARAAAELAPRNCPPLMSAAGRHAQHSAARALWRTGLARSARRGA